LVASRSLPRVVGAGAARGLAVIDAPKGWIGRTLSARRRSTVDAAARLLPLGGTVVNVLPVPDPDWFSVVRTKGDEAWVEARLFSDPAHVGFAIRCSPTEAPRLDRDVRDLAERVPAVLPLFGGAIDGGKCLVVADGKPRYAELPARELLASLTTGFEEYGLDFVALPEARHIAVQSRKAARRFLVWDVVDAALVADVAVHAAWPMDFASEAAPDGTVWAAAFDTLYNFDPHNWSLRASHRLREEPNGESVSWVRSSRDGETLEIGWTGVRQDFSLGEWPINIPTGSSVLELDCVAMTVEHVATFPEWTRAAVVRHPQADVIARSTHTLQPIFWRSPVERRPRRLYPPRHPSERVWM
jgi:hypothetical protein